MGHKKHVIIKKRLSYTQPLFDNIALGSQSIPDESRALVNTIVICVENHQGQNRGCFIWIRFGHFKSGDKGSGAHIQEDDSIFAFCLPEGRASPHLVIESG